MRALGERGMVQPPILGSAAKRPPSFPTLDVHFQGLFRRSQAVLIGRRAFPLYTRNSLDVSRAIFDGRVLRLRGLPCLPRPRDFLVSHIYFIGNCGKSIDATWASDGDGLSKLILQRR